MKKVHLGNSGAYSRGYFKAEGSRGREYGEIKFSICAWRCGGRAAKISKARVKIVNTAAALGNGDADSAGNICLHDKGTDKQSAAFLAQNKGTAGKGDKGVGRVWGRRREVTALYRAILGKRSNRSAAGNLRLRGQKSRGSGGGGSVAICERLREKSVHNGVDSCRLWRNVGGVAVYKRGLKPCNAAAKAPDGNLNGREGVVIVHAAKVNAGKGEGRSTAHSRIGV